MKRFLTVACLIIVSLMTYAQENTSLDTINSLYELEFIHNEQTIILHPDSLSGIYTQKIDSWYDYEYAKRPYEITYKIFENQELAYLNNQRLNHFAVTELISLAVGLAGMGTYIYGVNHNDTGAKTLGGVAVFSSSVAGVYGLCRLLRSNIGITSNGICIQYKITSK